MRDIGGLIWIVIVVIGVISSIAKNVKKAAAQREAARPRMAQPQNAAAPAPQLAVQRMVMVQPAIVPPVVPPPVRRAKVLPAAVPARVVMEREAGAGAVSPIRGMFGAGTSLVRAIVAAEVLGPPKALQEQSIWSPRHSEPSI
ncbi:MAG TPA: hypothetical protein VNF68_13455 [Candidatus Baltobacteraceae bacterium]|nr:hypothetical protein [Candidatus Baltobacteraceae bacterium]